ncbi:uncharacterized protein CDAR_237371 [Caerostris darwini]|uniref:Uncharacterized protein n=1 Tax=Caerostris darwini TaxID=1538125 RepID=A0AAV4QRA1_9ARAC|nr:uncharacterized protein CDAR_237371 [Caerostris darwini]
MSVLGKKGHGETAYEVPKDSLYFPSPYATTRVPGYVVEEGSECDSLRSSTRTPSDPQGSHTYDVPFPVRRPEYEEQYSQIKRVPLSTLQTSNVYQAPQYCDSEKLVSRWIGRPASEPCTFQLSQDSRGRRVQEEGRWYPSRYRTTSSSYPQEQRYVTHLSYSLHDSHHPAV